MKIKIGQTVEQSTDLIDKNNTSSVHALVSDEQTGAGLRLDKFLFKNFPDYSRAFFQQLIDQKHVFVNEQLAVKSSYMVRMHDRVACSLVVPQYDCLPCQVDFKVIDQQDDFLVINKPAGLLVHPATTSMHEPSLVQGLLFAYPEFSSFDDTVRPGIVHRLDRDTSGLLIVARNARSHIALAAMFKDRLVKKTYLAVVKGIIPDKGTIDDPIGRDHGQPHKMACWGIYHKPALTYYQVLERKGEHALVAVRIVTGRTHQIRVHLASIGCPVVGDVVYGQASDMIAGQALHSWRSVFTYADKQYAYVADMPEAMFRVLDMYKFSWHKNAVQVDPF